MRKLTVLVIVGLVASFGFTTETSVFAQERLDIFEPDFEYVVETGLNVESDPQVETFGTLVNWYVNPDDAFHEARRTGKLVYYFQLSGNLAHEAFT